MKQGWTMLKNGGVMVYSTCSLSIKQNEENVAWFLNEFKKEAKLEKIPECNIKPAHIKKLSEIDDQIQADMETHCIRFDPISSRTSGFFVARFKKILL
jgi:16S rRNA C967 or C1407 C5-methylase (RsmB/RsmF family)